jgi:SAM-dependent methyltransferase
MESRGLVKTVKRSVPTKIFGLVALALVLVIAISTSTKVNDHLQLKCATGDTAATSSQRCAVEHAPPQIAPTELRTGNRANFSDDNYLRAAATMVHQVVNALTMVIHNGSKKMTNDDYASLLRGKRILDFGCGAGRFLVGLLADGACFDKYVGIDVNVGRIGWLQGAYTDKSKYEFFQIDAHNARYNPKGQPIQMEDSESALSALGLPIASIEKESFDLIHLRSVFSHMVPEDCRKYLQALRPYLKPDVGILYVSLFVRDFVIPGEEDYIENPEPQNKGALHVVVIQKQVFETIVREAGYYISLVTNYNSQDTYLLRPGQLEDSISKSVRERQPQ